MFGSMLSMATLLPVFEMSRMNFRSGKSDYSASIALRLPPENLLTLALPNLFGSPKDYVGFHSDGTPSEGNPYWGKFDYIEYALYVGIPALHLAIR